MRALQKYLRLPPVQAWRYVALKCVAKLQYGAALSDSERKPGRIPVYGSNGPVGFHSHALVSGPGIVVGRKGTAGEVVWCEADFFPIDTTYFVEADQEEYSLRWLYYLLKHSDLGLLQASTGVPGLSRSDAYKLVVPVPEKPEQIRIARSLDKVDVAIAATQASIAAAQTLKQAFMQNLLSGKLKPDGTWRREEEFYIDPKFGRVPTGWSWRQVRTFGEIITGRTPPPADESNYAKDGFPFMTPGDIGESRFVVQTERYVTKVGLRFSNIIPAGAVCVVCIGSTIGKVGVAGTMCCSNQQINSLIPEEGNDSDFLYFLLRSQQEQLRLWAGVNATPQLNKSEFGKFRVLAPTNEDEQKAIAAPLLKIANVIDHKKLKIERLRVLKKGLMQSLLTGKIRIPAE